MQLIYHVICRGDQRKVIFPEWFGSEVLFGESKPLMGAKVDRLTSLRDSIDKPIVYQFLN
jgi:hypothetical protein